MTKKEFIIVLVITFIATMVWVISDIIFNTKPSVIIDAKLQSSLEDISPSFDNKILDQISKLSLPSTPIPQNTPAIFPSPLPLPSFPPPIIAKPSPQIPFPSGSPLILPSPAQSP